MKNEGHNMSTVDIIDLAETTIATIKALWRGEHDEELCALAKDLGNRVTYEAATDEDWDTDSDGDPVCRITTTVTLSVDDEEIGSGEAAGCYTECRRGRERYSEWQDGDGPEHDSNWCRIAAALTAAGVIDDKSDLDDSIEAPDAPSKPKQDPSGEYVVLYHGWEQAWCVHSRYATREDADRAARIADRDTIEANSPGAYGWEYAVAAISDDGDMDVGGLKVTILNTDEQV